MSEFDDLINLVGSFDWITPLVSFVQDAVNGPIGDFGVSALAGYNRKDIKRILAAKGVKSWGLMYSGDMIIFTVKRAQARWAYYLLRQEGVPIIYAPKGAGSK